jgi:signal transduction histidine kinase
MAPSIEKLLRQLRSSSSTERLEAARFFAEHAEVAHETTLREAAAKETVLWIKAALRRALLRLSAQSPPAETESALDEEEAPEGFSAQIYAEAIETTSSQLMHEIEPILGALRLAAESEIANFETSESRRCLDRLDEFLAALSRLRRAASAPRMETFSLNDAIQQCISEVPTPEGISIQKSGPQPCIVDGDKGLLSLSFLNGLRNAIEATAALGQADDVRPVVVAWGSTNNDYWVSVVDVGIGFRGNLQRALDIGTTTKPGHLGMGLAIAKQAMSSMGGRILIVPNDRGVRFEMRWPQPAA